MNKREARLRAYEIMRGVTGREEKSRIITERVLGFEEVKAARRIGVYFSLPEEVDTDGLIEALLAEKKELYAPVVTGDELIFHRVESLNAVKTGKFGVREPIGEETCEDLDVIIVPMVAFDEGLHRLGHGKGYYDRFLRGKRAVKIGVAFAEQRMEFDTDEWDEKMTYCVCG